MTTPSTSSLRAARPACEDDAGLVTRSLDEARVFATVFDRHWPALHAFCASRAGTAGEDIAAEVFRIAFDERRRFDGAAGGVRRRLYGIALNLLRRHFRTAERGRRAASRLHRGDVGDHGDDALGRVEAERLGPRLAAALAGIPRDDRDALLLLAWAGLSYEEIAEAMQVPTGTVRSRIHRARSRVRAHLDREDAR